MARGRMISATLGGSRKFSRLTNNDARLVYCLLLAHADAYGRVEADPDYVKGTVLSRIPISTDDVQAALEDMHAVNLIHLYTVDGFQYAQFESFADHNRTYPSREAQTTIPGPDGNVPERPPRDDQGEPETEPSQDSGATKTRPRRGTVPENKKRKEKKEVEREEDLNPPTPLPQTAPPATSHVEPEARPPIGPEPPRTQRSKKLKTHEFDPDTVALDLPPQFDRDRFLDFCRMRQKIGAPMTLEALKAFLRKHQKHPKHVLDEMFDNAIAANWKDLWPLKHEQAAGPPRSSATRDLPTTADFEHVPTNAELLGMPGGDPN